MARGAKLEAAAVAARMQEVPGWDVKSDTLVRTLKFADFVQAFAFMTAVALRAQEMDHHPDWQNVYDKVTITLSSHDVQGISDRDFKLATMINTLATSFGGA